MARSGHGLPKLLTGTAMPNPSTTSGGATPDWPFQEFQQCGWPAAIFYPLRHPTPYTYVRYNWFVVQGHANASHFDLS
jgi:hypothetical protein